MTTQIPTQKQYEDREWRMFYEQIRLVESQSIAEKREAAAQYRTACIQYPERVGQEVRHLLAGNYQFAPLEKAKLIVASPSLNRVAELGQLAAALAWMVPSGYSRDVYKKITAEQQDKLNSEIQFALNEYVANEELENE